ncbi:hypothetical protein DZC78_14470 [Olleya aquimaris]|nr:hypothetical protein DZC78_14470 [Olleya aquimaris]
MVLTVTVKLYLSNPFL